MKLKELYKISKELGVNIEFRDKKEYGIGNGIGHHFKIENDLDHVIDEICHSADRDGFTDFYLYV